MKLTKRKKELLKLSSELFYKMGYAGATMKLLAEKAELEPASFYSHFSSKEDILYRISRLFLVSLMETLNNQPVGTIEELIQLFLEHCFRHPTDWAVIYKNHHYLEDEYKQEIDALILELDNIIANFINAAINSWNIKAIDNQIIRTYLYNVLCSIPDLIHSEADEMSLMDSLNEMLLRGIKQ